jgi:hypothetical protein
MGPGTPDPDRDSIGNSCDNCDYAYNSDQADNNGNGVGDVCDCDSSLGTLEWVKMYDTLSLRDIQPTAVNRERGKKMALSAGEGPEADSAGTKFLVDFVNFLYKGAPGPCR